MGSLGIKKEKHLNLFQENLTKKNVSFEYPQMRWLLCMKSTPNTCRIIPVSKWVVTPIIRPLKAHLEGETTLRTYQAWL